MNDVVRARGPFLTLIALKKGPKHGYEIASYIKEKGGGFFSLSYGSLYPILHNLEKDGLIKGDWEDVGDAKSKKVYSLTARGRRALEDETVQYRNLIKVFAKLLEVKV